MSEEKHKCVNSWNENDIVKYERCEIVYVLRAPARALTSENTDLFYVKAIFYTLDCDVRIRRECEFRIDDDDDAAATAEWQKRKKED